MEMDSNTVFTITTLSISLLSAVVTFLITYFKTKTSAIEKKVDSSVCKANDKLRKAYVEINGIKYYLKDLVIRTEEVNDEK